MAGKRVLNTFAYTCGFSVTCARAGATTTSVDVSKRYLEWGKRNFALNDIEPKDHYFTCVDALEFLDFARRKTFSFDLVILDPPSFGSGKKGRSFSATNDYGELLEKAARIVAPGGRIFASTNNTTLATGDAFDAIINKSLGGAWRQAELPALPVDFANERGRLACRLMQQE
jgi:23S rRNA (cytosine1962-C5)-methyltransferase